MSKCSDYIADTFMCIGVKDAFGIPGGVILELMYAFDRTNSIQMHLSYHEQGAGFAACGFSQASGKPCLVFATKGPGVLNLMTTVVEAYYDSLPVIFVTAHSSNVPNPRLRSEKGQELDTESIFERYVKKYKRFDTIEDLLLLKEIALESIRGRKGPVFLDFHTGLLERVFNSSSDYINKGLLEHEISCHDINYNRVFQFMSNAKRPVVLIGDGIRNTQGVNLISDYCEKTNIPILSSRYSQDIFAGCRYYYGYIGSHATRYSNFILSKTDLIIALGNRLNLNPASRSFAPLLEKVNIIRVDIDSSEYIRSMPHEEKVNTNYISFMKEIGGLERYNIDDKWIEVCDTIKSKLIESDVDSCSRKIAELLKRIPKKSSIVVDVGNNELWVSRAYAYSNVTIPIFHSKTLKTVGNALAKAIGVYYATKNPVICVSGDEGIQFNIQELHAIASNKLPIMILLVNNHSAGMMKSEQARKGYDASLLSTYDSGYSNPSFERIGKAYGIDTMSYSEWINREMVEIDMPVIVEMSVYDELEPYPILPFGNMCQEMYPLIDGETYDNLNNL